MADSKELDRFLPIRQGELLDVSLKGKTQAQMGRFIAITGEKGKRKLTLRPRPIDEPLDLDEEDIVDIVRVE